MKPREIRELTSEQAEEKLRELKQEMFQIRLQSAAGKQTNPQRLRGLRRDFARIETIRKEKSRGG